MKLAAQFGAAAIALSSGLSVEIVSNDVLAWIIGLLWLVGMTNAFNLLDNMDGLAGTLALIAAVFFAIDAVTVHEERLLLVLSLSLGLACLGFLLFNFRPGKPALVFMGDSGSQVLGFTLGALGLATSWKVAETTVATLMLPILVLAIPILDTALVTAVRMRERRPIHQGGKDHTSHRLVRGGLSEQKTVVLLAAIAAGLGATAPRLLRARRLPDHARRRSGHVRAPRPVRRLPRRPRARQHRRDRGGPGRLDAANGGAPPAAAAGGAARLRADQRLLHRRVSR